MRIVKLKGMRQVNGLHYAPDGRRLLAVGGYEVRSVDEARWVDVGEAAETLRVPLNALSYSVSHDLSKIAVGSSGNFQASNNAPAVVVFDPADQEWHEDKSRQQSAHLGKHARLNSLALAPLGDRVAVSYLLASTRLGFPLRFTIFPLGARSRAREMSKGEASATLTLRLTYSPDGKHLAGASNSSTGFVQIIDGKTARYLGCCPPLNSRIRQIEYSPDSSMLVAVGTKHVYLFPAGVFAKKVQQFPADVAKQRVTLAHPKQVNAVAFTPDGRRILTTCTDKLVRVWDATTGQLVTSYDWNVGVTNAIAVAPDGLTAAVGGQSGRVVLFDLDA